MANLITLKADGTFKCEIVRSPLKLEDMRKRLNNAWITYVPRRSNPDRDAEDFRGRACVVADDEGLCKQLPFNRWCNFIVALGYNVPFEFGGLAGDLLLVAEEDAEGEHRGAIDARLVECVRAYGQADDLSARHRMLASLDSHGRIQLNDEN